MTDFLESLVAIVLAFCSVVSITTLIVFFVVFVEEIKKRDK